MVDGNVANGVSNSVSNDSLSGPKVAHNSNVDRPKVAGNNSGNNSNSSKKSKAVKQPEPTLLKLSQISRPK